MKERLVELPSGGIDLAMVDGELRLQFNTTCEDALPYCHAMCCRMKQGYGPEIAPSERLYQLGSVRTVVDDSTGATLTTVPVKKEKPDECLFLDRGDKCSVQDIKPEECRNWHCSPGGLGEGLTTRASGWRLIPTQR